MADDRCACGCSQDRHRMGRGSCKDCPRFDCEVFDPLEDPPEVADQHFLVSGREKGSNSEADPLSAAVYAEHFPVQLLEVEVAPVETPEPPSEPLESFNAWRCAVCGSRKPARENCRVTLRCQGRVTEPVTVEIRRREVSDGQT